MRLGMLGAGLLSAVMLGGVAGSVQAQECLTCRTEKCPKKPGVKDWCGAGRDPLHRSHAPKVPVPEAQPAPEPVVMVVPSQLKPMGEASPVVPVAPPVIKAPVLVAPAQDPVPAIALVVSPPPSAPRHFYKRWWFWTAVGGVVAAGVVGGVLAATKPWALPVPPEIHDLRGQL